MKKEIFLAIIIGLLVGLLLTYGFYRTRLALSRPQTSGVALSSPQPSPVIATRDLALVSPEDEIVQTEKTTYVTGTTKPNSFVAIFVNNAETLTQADTAGNFSVLVNLETGSNIITVNVIDENGAITSLERTVIIATISNDGLGGTSSTSGSATATGSAVKTPAPAR